MNTTVYDDRLAEALAAIDAAADAEALEAQRIAALGKQGWVSAALKTLGGMSPEERQEQEARIQQLIKSRRFDEAIQLGEELIKRFPNSPQSDAMEELLPKLRERAVKQNTEKI